MAVPGFYWLDEGRLAGCGRPGGRRGDGFHGGGGFGLPPAPDDPTLDQDLAWLRDIGIGAVLTLTEGELPEAALARHGLEGRHLPVPDLAAPTPEQIRLALAFLDWHHADGRAVAVHCRMGQGRTGTVLAADLIRRGVAPAAAIDEVRAVCPHAVESPSQARALHEFAAERGWLL
jgi:atypical dual specificity phosphatase